MSKRRASRENENESSSAHEKCEARESAIVGDSIAETCLGVFSHYRKENVSDREVETDDGDRDCESATSSL